MSTMFKCVECGIEFDTRESAIACAAEDARRVELTRLRAQIQELQEQNAAARAERHRMAYKLEAAENQGRAVTSQRDRLRAANAELQERLSASEERLERFGVLVMEQTGRVLLEPERITDADVISSAVMAVRVSRDEWKRRAEAAEEERKQWCDAARRRDIGWRETKEQLAARDAELVKARNNLIREGMERDEARAQLAAEKAARERDRVTPIIARAIADARREGFRIAQDNAEISEHDGWVRTAPCIDWERAEKALAEREPEGTK